MNAAGTSISAPPPLTRALKRAFDLAVAVPLFVITAPVMAVVAAVVRIRLGSPVLFRQTRPGLGERPFVIFKFRTMIDAVDGDDRPLPDEQRLTSLGSFLRRLSLDELPSLVNVICGDMSIVGPRPLLTQYLPVYTERERARFLVRPGITGVSQVSGRNELHWDERLERDAEYVADMSVLGDLEILARTVACVVRADGVAVDTDVVEMYLDEERTGVRNAPHDGDGTA